MRYNVLKKALGTKKIDLIKTIETHVEIKDACWVNDLGIVYTYCNKLGLLSIDGDNYPLWKGADGKIRNGDNPSFGNLSGISYGHGMHTLFVCEDGGRDVRSIDVKNNYTSNCFRGVIKESVSQMLKSFSIDCKAFISHAGNENFFIAYPDLHKLFLYHGSAFYHIAGDGKCRFSVGNTLKNTSIGNPSGVVTYNGSVLMADSFCGLIRKVGKNELSIIAGHPSESVLNEPSKMVLNKDTLYIMCKNGIYTFSLRDGKLGNGFIYESERLANMVVDESNVLYIMEMVDA